MTLEREIEEALAVEPSVEFMGRVRRRIASLPAPSRWLQVRRYVLALSTSLAFAAVILRVSKNGGEKRTAPAIPGITAVASDVRPPVLFVAPKVRRKVPSESRVLFDPAESDGIQHFLDALAKGPLDVSSEIPGPPKEIAVEPIPAFAPITIGPITPGSDQD